MPSDTNPTLPPDSTRLYSAVDRSDESYEPSPHASRRVIPSGRVSPDGRRTWPQPSLTSKVVIFGGMGIAAAAATAGAVLGIKAIVDAIAGDHEDGEDAPAARQQNRTRRTGGARPSSYGPRSTSALGFSGARGDWDRRYADSRREERPRHEATRRRPPAAHGAGVAETVSSVASSVRDVLETVTAAIEGFRSVAAQAGEIAADFNRATDQVRTIMEPSARPHPRRQRPETAEAELREDEVVASDPRNHRL